MNPRYTEGQNSNPRCTPTLRRRDFLTVQCSWGRRVESNWLLTGPGSWGGSREDLVRLNSSEFKNLASGCSKRWCEVKTLRKDDSCDSTLAICMNYLSMACLVDQSYEYVKNSFTVFFNCIDTYISTYQLAGDTFIMNKYLNGIVTTIYNCYIVGIKGCYIKWIILYTFLKSNRESIAEDIL